MTKDVHEFLILGHEKVIGHYKFLLASKGVSQPERALDTGSFEERRSRLPKPD